MTTWNDVSDAVSTWSGTGTASSTWEVFSGYVDEGYIIDQHDYVMSGSIGIDWDEASNAVSSWSGSSAAVTTWS